MEISLDLLIIRKENYIMANNIDNIIIEGAHLLFKNFSGKPSKFNAEGSRNFCVVIEKDFAETLKEDGWNVKELSPKEEGDDPRYYIPVAVKYGAYPPKIILISGKNKNLLSEESVGSLDWAEIKNVDLVIRPYPYEVNGKSGIKAYVKTMYVTIADDPFADKYDDTQNVDIDDDLPF